MQGDEATGAESVTRGVSLLYVIVKLLGFGLKTRPNNLFTFIKPINVQYFDKYD